MNRLRALLLGIALVAACGPSGAPPQTRVGVAAAPPPSGRTITYDPSVVGLPAAVNTTVYDSQGVISWVKYGTSNTAWRPVPVTQIVTGDPSQAPGLKAPPGFVVTKNDGTASWIKKTTSDTGWVVNPVSGADGGTPLSAPVANASLATMPGHTVKGNSGADAAVPSDLTQTLLTALINVATPSTAGLMTAAQAATLANTTGAIVLSAFSSAEVDLMTTTTGIVVAPAIAGKSWFSTGLFMEITQFAGSLTTGPTSQYFEGANVLNTAQANLPTTANVALGVPTRINVGSNAAYALAPNTALTVNVTLGAVGSGLTLKAIFISHGFYL